MSENAPAGRSAAIRCLTSIDSGIAFVERQILAISVMLMAINTVANVIARIGFSSSLFFAEEFNQFLIVLVTFVGASTAARYGRHIRMSAITDILPEKPRKVMMTIIAIVTAALLFALMVFSISYLLSLYESNRLTPSLRLPVYIIYSFVPLGLFLTAIQYVFAAAANILSPGVHLSYTVKDVESDGQSSM